MSAFPPRAAATAADRRVRFWPRTASLTYSRRGSKTSGLQQFRAVFGSEGFGLLHPLCHSSSVQLWRWRYAARQWIADCHKEFFLPRRRAHAQHMHGAPGSILEHVRCIGRDVYSRSGTHGFCFAPEGELQLAVKQCKHLLEIVAMKRWAAAVGHNHVNQAVSASGLRTGNEDAVCATHDRDVSYRRTVRVSDC